MKRWLAAGIGCLARGIARGVDWSIALDTGTGKLAATLIDRDGAIVLLGARTVQ